MSTVARVTTGARPMNRLVALAMLAGLLLAVYLAARAIVKLTAERRTPARQSGVACLQGTPQVRANGGVPLRRGLALLDRSGSAIWRWATPHSMRRSDARASPSGGTRSASGLASPTGA